MDGNGTSTKTALRDEEEDDDDVIEILDSPVKIPERSQRKQSAIIDNLAPVFNIFSKPEAGPSKGKHPGSSPSVKQENRTRAEKASSSSILRPQEKRTPEDLEDSPKIKKHKPDPVKQAQPLAERLRPTSLSTFVGQTDLVGQGSLLRSMLESGNSSGSSSSSTSFGSIILWGPPGCGKTTMARLIANKADADFRELSATSSGSADVRKVFEQARNQLKLLGRRTVLFIDEIHRFTKPQQDLFLPFVETGSVTLIGATTENPSFKVNGALLSRCRVFTLNKLSPPELEQILKNALDSYPPPLPRIPPTLLAFLAEVSDGDARQALNSLELAMSVCLQKDRGQSRVYGEEYDSGADGESEARSKAKAQAKAATDAEDEELMSAIKRGLRKGYDRTGEERYDMISALHKSIRGSDGSAALYWLARMLEGGEDPLYIARRLVVVASEDVGLADPHGLPLAMATHQACQVIGMPECRLNLAHCVAYLSEAEKSTRAYQAYGKAVALARETPLPDVPLQIRNAPTNLMKTLGYGKHYSYNPDYKHPVHNEYLPAELQDRSTFGSDSLLQTEDQYRKGKDKTWDESKLLDWEWKQNKGKDWEGRKGGAG